MDETFEHDHGDRESYQARREALKRQLADALANERRAK
jgi:hypothetical protein